MYFILTESQSHRLKLFLKLNQKCKKSQYSIILQTLLRLCKMSHGSKVVSLRNLRKKSAILKQCKVNITLLFMWKVFAHLVKDEMCLMCFSQISVASASSPFSCLEFQNVGAWMLVFTINFLQNDVYFYLDIFAT